MKFSLDKRERFCILQIEEDKLLSNHSPSLKSEMLSLQRDGFKNVILDFAGKASCSVQKFFLSRHFKNFFLFVTDAEVD